MSFMLIKYKAEEEQYEKYNGKIAATLGWIANSNEPYMERYVIVTPRDATDYPAWVLDPPIRSNDVRDNTIRFSHYSLHRPVVFMTEKMVKFTERKPVPKPRTRWNRYGERKKYAWHWGKWVPDGYEYREE